MLRLLRRSFGYFSENVAGILMASVGGLAAAAAAAAGKRGRR